MVNFSVMGLLTDGGVDPDAVANAQSAILGASQPAAKTSNGQFPFAGQDFSEILAESLAAVRKPGENGLPALPSVTGRSELDFPETDDRPPFHAQGMIESVVLVATANPIPDATNAGVDPQTENADSQSARLTTSSQFSDGAVDTRTLTAKLAGHSADNQLPIDRLDGHAESNADSSQVGAETTVINRSAGDLPLYQHQHAAPADNAPTTKIAQQTGFQSPAPINAQLANHPLPITNQPVSLANVSRSGPVRDSGSPIPGTELPFVDTEPVQNSHRLGAAQDLTTLNSQSGDILDSQRSTGHERDGLTSIISQASGHDVRAGQSQTRQNESNQYAPPVVDVREPAASSIRDQSTGATLAGVVAGAATIANRSDTVNAQVESDLRIEVSSSRLARHATEDRKTGERILGEFHRGNIGDGKPRNSRSRLPTSVAQAPSNQAPIESMPRWLTGRTDPQIQIDATDQPPSRETDSRLSQALSSSFAGSRVETSLADLHPTHQNATDSESSLPNAGAGETQIADAAATDTAAAALIDGSPARIESGSFSLRGTTNQSADFANHADIENQIAVKLNSAILQASTRDATTQVELQLDPPHLGTVVVRIDWDPDTTRIRIQTDNTMARQVLERNVDSLINMLNGVDVNSAEVDITHREQHHGDDREHLQQSWHSRNDSGYRSPDQAANTNPLRAVDNAETADGVDMIV